MVSSPEKPTDDVLRCTKEIVIQNRNGLHARPAAMFVKISSRFRADVGWKRMVSASMARASWV